MPGYICAYIQKTIFNYVFYVSIIYNFSLNMFVQIYKHMFMHGRSKLKPLQCLEEHELYIFKALGMI